MRYVRLASSECSRSFLVTDHLAMPYQSRSWQRQQIICSNEGPIKARSVFISKQLKTRRSRLKSGIWELISLSRPPPQKTFYCIFFPIDESDATQKTASSVTEHDPSTPPGDIAPPRDESPVKVEASSAGEDYDPKSHLLHTSCSSSTVASRDDRPFFTSTPQVRASASSSLSPLARSSIVDTIEQDVFVNFHLTHGDGDLKEKEEELKLYIDDQLYREWQGLTQRQREGIMSDLEIFIYVCYQNTTDRKDMVDAANHDQLWQFLKADIEDSEPVNGHIASKAGRGEGI
ncbi:hypothetical protein IWZ03DRAFT_355862 [Phyllosticta citriasiana]|uniref:Uncharacterized protein n=1 Tax=Phyllosticta citriasiana TaxID=595635 RepID=A0ABR1KYR1_9PEZI